MLIKFWVPKLCNSYLVPKFMFMQLVLSVGEKVLDRIKLKQEFILNDDYLNAHKRLLLTKHKLFIIALQDAPVFYIEAFSGADNKAR